MSSILPVPLFCDNEVGYWFDNNVALTNFMNVLSSLFPQGELFFMKSITAYLKDYPDLKEDISVFCKQERNHTKVHEQINNQCHNSVLVNTLDNTTGKLLRRVSKMLSKKQRLIVTVNLEHVTALLAQQLLDRPDIQNKMKDSMKDVWLYHAQEETSEPHKSIASTVYNRLTKGKSKEVDFYMYLSLTMLSLVIVSYWVFLMSKEKGVKLSDLKHGYSVLFNKNNGFVTNITKDLFNRVKSC